MAGEGYNVPGFKPRDPSARIGWHSAAATQTWTKGDMLARDGSGDVIIATAASTELIGVAADARSSTSALENVPVYDDPDEVFVGLVNADASGTAPGAQVDLVGTTGAHLINVGASATDVLTFLRVLPDETISAQYAQAEVRITHGKHSGQ